MTSLGEMFKLIRQSLVLVIALPLLCAAIAAGICWGLLEDEYTAETSIYALAKSDSSSESDKGVSYTDLSASQLLANDFAQLAESTQVRDAAAKELGYEDLDDFDIKIVSDDSTRVIRLAVTSRDAQSAAVVANEIADQLGQTAIRVMNVEAVNVIDAAEVPKTPSGPHRSYYVAIAFLVGFFGALAIVLLRDSLNRNIRNEEEAQRVLGIPVIGRYPLEKEGRR